MVKNRKSANNTSGGNVSTGVSEEKSKTWVLDDTLSPLICRKLRFDSKKPGSFNENLPKKIVSHSKTKKSVLFEIEWQPNKDEFVSNSKVTLKNAKKNCPELVIDYLISKI